MSTYTLYPARIDAVRDETSDIKTYRFVFVDDHIRDGFTYTQGQFAQIALPGFGEAPISITSSPSRKGFLEFTIRAVGKLTKALSECKEGDIVFIRGPYGNSFPYDQVKDKNLVFVAGGIGLPPLRSVINLVLDDKASFRRVKILYGARSPEELCFEDELAEWGKRPDVDVLLTVDKESPGWTGRVGLVTELWDEANLSGKDSVAYVCGPPIMIKFVVAKLKEVGFADDSIFVTLERHMQCGVGKCGHCNVGAKFVCTDGPVFSYAEIKTFPAKEGAL